VTHGPGERPVSPSPTNAGATYVGRATIIRTEDSGSHDAVGDVIPRMVGARTARPDGEVRQRLRAAVIISPARRALAA
jgi:hypothetical protein